MVKVRGKKVKGLGKPRKEGVKVRVERREGD